MLDYVFVRKRTDSSLSSHTFSWSWRAGITLSRPWRSVNFDREQSANAMWCHSTWWQLCGEWKHADRCGSLLLQLSQCSQAPLPEWQGQSVGKLWALPIPTNLIHSSALDISESSIQSCFLCTDFDTVVTFWVLSISFLNKGFYNSVIYFKIL